MKITRVSAIRLWEQFFGDSEYFEDFHGYLMCKKAYGDNTYFVWHHGKQIYCGWNIHHILPVALGGTNIMENLICTNIATNDAAGNRTTYWIDGSLYQVQRIHGTGQHEIIKLN